jgi:hypothetical protein
MPLLLKTRHATPRPAAEKSPHRTLLRLALCIAATLEFVVLPAAIAAAAEQAKFTVGGEEFRLSLPDGFCLPVDEFVEFARVAEQLDQTNMTDTTFVRCSDIKQHSEPTGWGMMKTPRASIGKKVPSRSEIIAYFQSNIKNPEIFQSLNNPDSLINKRFQDVFGLDANVKSSLQPLAVDDKAGYIGGTVSGSVKGHEIIVAGAAAATVVRDRIFFYYLFRPYKSPKDIAELLPLVKAGMLQFIVENEP